MINRFDLPDDSLIDYCQIITKQIINNLRPLKYFNHLTSIKDASIDNLIFLRNCAFAQQDIADLLHCSVSTITARLKNYKPKEHDDEDVESVMREIISANVNDPMESLMSKWRQLNELRFAKNDEIKIKAVRLQADIEILIQEHKEKILSFERLTEFIRLIETHVSTVDRWLRHEIEQINLMLAELGSTRRLAYQSISAMIRGAIESNKPLLEVREMLEGKETIDVEVSEEINMPL